MQTLTDLLASLWSVVVSLFKVDKTDLLTGVADAIEPEDWAKQTHNKDSSESFFILF